MPRPPKKAQAIADTLASAITTGSRSTGTWLPSERALCQTYQVDRSTVRRALRMLEQRHLVILRHGVGAQVQGFEPLRREAADITAQTGKWRGFHVSASAAGREPYTETAVRDVAVDTPTARWLGVPTGTEVLERVRVQGVVGEPPVQLSTSWISSEVADRLPILHQVDTGPGGMHSRMEEAGYRLRFEDAVTCRLPDRLEQERLQVSPDHPVLDVWRRCYDERDRVLEVTHRVIVGHRHELIYRYDH